MLEHIVHQGAVLRALAGTAASAIAPARRTDRPLLPGPEITATLPPRPAALVRDYVRHVGGDPAAYRGVVPAHMFPQWSFPLAARALAGLPYPMVKVINAGCRLEMRAPLPAGEPLRVAVRLERVDDDGRRAVLEQRIVTGTASAPDAVEARLFAFVPLARAEGERGDKRDRARVPDGARELTFGSIDAGAGLAFAALTGDVNPIHWLRPWARALGFRATILHGFSTLARAIEAMNRALFAGDVRALSSIDVRFVRPLPLPARVGVYVAGDRVFVGDAPGGGAYLEGRFTARTP